MLMLLWPLWPFGGLTASAFLIFYGSQWFLFAVPAEKPWGVLCLLLAF
jgi:hypothetical protein